MIGSAIAANEIQTERNRKRRRDGHVPEEPTSTPLLIGLIKKSPVKKKIKRGFVKSKPVKGPGPLVQKPVEEKVLTREERIVEMEKQKGPSPLQSVFIQVYVLYSWKAVTSKVGEVASVPHQSGWTSIIDSPITVPATTVASPITAATNTTCSPNTTATGRTTSPIIAATTTTDVYSEAVVPFAAVIGKVVVLATAVIGKAVVIAAIVIGEAIVLDQYFVHKHKLN
uniref:Uncharacterized protein n=1 Tax=Solanum tuberosum TaxID=4113 RepID=M1DBC4_SOLTU